MLTGRVLSRLQVSDYGRTLSIHWALNVLGQVSYSHPIEESGSSCGLLLYLHYISGKYLLTTLDGQSYAVGLMLYPCQCLSPITSVYTYGVHLIHGRTLPRTYTSASQGSPFI